MNNLNLNFYQILEIDKNATQQEIRQKYLILALKYHPDRNRNLEYYKYLECEEKFKLIIRAAFCSFFYIVMYVYISYTPMNFKEYAVIYNVNEL